MVSQVRLAADAVINPTPKTDVDIWLGVGSGGETQKLSTDLVICAPKHHITASDRINAFCRINAVGDDSNGDPQSKSREILR